MIAQFNNFEIKMTRRQAESVSHSGDCFNDAQYLVRFPAIKKQLQAIGAEKIKAELDEYGAWTEEELNDNEQNEIRLVWIAGCNIIEELYQNKRR